MTTRTALVGISVESTRFGFVGFGMSGLWGCAFSGHDYSWNKYHDTSMGVILLGGWKDDFSFDAEHHVHRIFIDQIPSLDTAKISIARTFPLRTETELKVRGFILSSGDFQSPYPASIERGLNAFEIDYLKREKKEINVASHLEDKEKREEKFDFVSGVWLADGRIFAENDEVVQPLLKLGASVASRVHNGMWWKTLPNEDKK